MIESQQPAQGINVFSIQWVTAARRAPDRFASDRAHMLYTFLFVEPIDKTFISFSPADLEAARLYHDPEKFLLNLETVSDRKRS